MTARSVAGHLELGATRCFLDTEIVRVACRVCRRVRTETVPWARPRSRHTRDFQDVVCYLAPRTDKTAIWDGKCSGGLHRGLELEQLESSLLEWGRRGELLDGVRAVGQPHGVPGDVASSRSRLRAT